MFFYYQRFEEEEIITQIVRISEVCDKIGDRVSRKLNSPLNCKKQQA